MYASRRRKIVWLSPSTMSVSATYRVVRKLGSLSKESMMESEGGKDRDGAVGRPSLRAVEGSTLWPRVVSCAPGGRAFAAVSRTARCGAVGAVSETRHTGRASHSRPAHADDGGRHAEAGVEGEQRGKVEALGPQQHCEAGAQARIVAGDGPRPEPLPASRRRGDDQALRTLIK